MYIKLIKWDANTGTYHHWDVVFSKIQKTQLDTDHIYRLFDFIEQIIILINHNDPYYDHK